MSKNNDIYNFKIDDSESYFRRYTTTDYVMIGLMILLTITGFGFIFALAIAFIYPRMTSQICISEYSHPDKKMWISKTDWDDYRTSNDVSLFQEYRRAKRFIPEKETSIGVADELAKYKKLLDNEIITDDEYNAKKKQLLNL